MENPELLIRMMEAVKIACDDENKVFKCLILVDWAKCCIWFSCSTEADELDFEYGTFKKKKGKSRFLRELAEEISRYSILNHNISIQVMTEEEIVLHTKSCRSLRERVCDLYGYRLNDVYELKFKHDGCEMDLVMVNKSFVNKLSVNLESLVFTINYFNPMLTNELLVNLLDTNCKSADEIVVICVMNRDDYSQNQGCVKKAIALIKKRLTRLEKEYSEKHKPLDDEPKPEAVSTNRRNLRSRTVRHNASEICDLTEEEVTEEFEVQDDLSMELSMSSEDESFGEVEYQRIFDWIDLEAETPEVEEFNLDPEKDITATSTSVKSLHISERSSVKEVQKSGDQEVLLLCQTSVEEQQKALDRWEKTNQKKAEPSSSSNPHETPTGPLLGRGLTSHSKLSFDYKIPKKPVIPKNSKLFDDSDRKEFDKPEEFAKAKLPKFSGSSMKDSNSSKLRFSHSVHSTPSPKKRTIIMRKPIHREPVLPNYTLDDLKMPSDNNCESPRSSSWPRRTAPIEFNVSSTPQSVAQFIDGPETEIIDLDDDEEISNENSDVNNNGGPKKRKLYRIEPVPQQEPKSKKFFKSREHSKTEKPQFGK